MHTNYRILIPMKQKHITALSDWFHVMNNSKSNEYQHQGCCIQQTDRLELWVAAKSSDTSKVAMKITLMSCLNTAQINFLDSFTSSSSRFKKWLLSRVTTTLITVFYTNGLIWQNNFRLHTQTDCLCGRGLMVVSCWIFRYHFWFCNVLRGVINITFAQQ